MSIVKIRSRPVRFDWSNNDPNEPFISDPYWSLIENEPNILSENVINNDQNDIENDLNSIKQ
jgi:hypothetical protein